MWPLASNKEETASDAAAAQHRSDMSQDVLSPDPEFDPSMWYGLSLARPARSWRRWEQKEVHGAAGGLPVAFCVTLEGLLGEEDGSLRNPFFFFFLFFFFARLPTDVNEAWSCICALEANTNRLLLEMGMWPRFSFTFLCACLRGVFYCWRGCGL